MIVFAVFRECRVQLVRDDDSHYDSRFGCHAVYICFYVIYDMCFDCEQDIYTPVVQYKRMKRRPRYYLRYAASLGLMIVGPVCAAYLIYRPLPSQMSTTCFYLLLVLAAFVTSFGLLWFLTTYVEQKDRDRYEVYLELKKKAYDELEDEERRNRKYHEKE